MTTTTRHSQHRQVLGAGHMVDDMDKYSMHQFAPLQAPEYTATDSHKLSFKRRIGADRSYSGGFGSMCGKPHVVFVGEARGVEDTDPSAGNVVPLLLGLYALLAVLSLARLVIPSLSSSLTAFQVLQGDPAAPAAGRRRRDLSLYEGTWKPVESTEGIPDILDRADHGHGDPDLDNYGAPLAPVVSVKYQGHYQPSY